MTMHQTAAPRPSDLPGDLPGNEHPSSSPHRPTPEALAFRVRPIVVLSHPRSGTHLMIDGLRHFFRETRLKQRFNQPVHDLYLNLDRLDDSHPYAAKPEVFRRRFATATQRVIVKSHCTVEVDQVGPSYRGLAQAVFDAADLVCVVRDVRPVLASYMALRPLKFPDSPTNLHDFLRSRLDADLMPAEGWAHHVRGWLEHDPRSKFLLTAPEGASPAVIPLAQSTWGKSTHAGPAPTTNDGPRLVVVRFEDMMKNYAGVIEATGRAIGLTPNGRPIRIFDKPTSIRQNKIRRLLGRQHSSSIDNLRMKFATPRWQDAMTPDDLALIHAQAGEVMARLGYRMG